MDDNGWTWMERDGKMMENGAPSMLCFSAVSWMDIRALSAVVMTEEVENSWPGLEIQRQISFLYHAVAHSPAHLRKNVLNSK